MTTYSKYLPPEDKEMEDLRKMLILSKTDEGMAELLEKARMYYLLKKPAEPVQEEPIVTTAWTPTTPIGKITPKTDISKAWWKLI